MMRHPGILLCLTLWACSTTQAPRLPDPAHSEAEALLAQIKAHIAASEARLGVKADRVMMHPDIWTQLRVLTHGRPVETVIGVPVVVRSEVYEWTVIMRVDDTR